MSERSEIHNEHLSQDEARTLAKMMWNQMRLNEYGTVPTKIPQNYNDRVTLQNYGIPGRGFEKRPDFEDYEAAYQAIEELKKVAGEESAWEKVGHLFVRVILGLSYHTQKELMLIFTGDRHGAEQKRQKYLEKKEKWTDPSTALKNLKKTKKPQKSLLS